MKRKLCIFTIVGLVASSFAAFAQNNPQAADAASSTPAAASTNEIAQAQPAPDAAASTNAPVAEVAAPTAAVAPDPVAQGAQPGAIIPLIVMDDVPLTDAIKNLAR